MTKSKTRPKSRFYVPESILTYGSVVLVIVIGFYVAAQFIQPAPPNHFKLAVGSNGGAYYQAAEKYAAFLKSHRVTIEFVETSGALENMRLLEEGSVEAALLQSGLSTVQSTKNIEALGALYHEALWVFFNKNVTASRLHDLKGKTLYIGGKGSGTFAISQQLLKDNGVSEANTNINTMPLSDMEVIYASLKSGAFDAVFMVGGYDDPNIQKYLNDADISLMHFDRAPTYTKKYRYLSHIVLPEGLTDLTQNIPPQDVSLISPSAILAVHSEFYGALKSLLTHMIHEVHDIEGPFNTFGDFPTIRHVDFQIASEAQRYYEHGPSLLQRYLPFWLVDMLDRLKVMLIPILGLLFPLLKIAPPTYRWRIRSKIYRWYKDLKRIESQGLASQKSQELNELLEELDRIDDEAKLTPVPLSYTDALYDLRLHIKLVRDHLKETKL